MAEHLETDSIRQTQSSPLNGKSLLWFCHRTLALFIGFLLLSESIAATATATSISIAQQPETSSPNPTTTDEQQAFAQAKQLFEQAEQLAEQGTAQSRQQALTKYEEALKIWQQLAVNEAPPYEARHFEVSTLVWIGTIYSIQSEPEKALGYFDRGLAVSRDLKNRLQEAIARTSADSASSNSEDKQKLLHSYKQALTSANLGEAALLGSLGGAYSSLGGNQKALDYYDQALSLYQAEKQRSNEARTLSSIGILYFKLGKTQSSLDFYNRALEIQLAEKDIAAQAQTLWAIGLLHTQLGESQKALAAYEQALELHQERKDLAGQVDILGQIGLLYSSLGENQKALDFYNQALKLHQAAQENLSGTALTFNLSQRADILVGIANSYTLLGSNDYSKALDFYNQALTLYQKVRNPRQEANVLNQISYLYKILGEKQKALDVLNQALVLQRSISAPDREALTLRDIADIYHSMSEPQQALDLYNQALALQRRLNDSPGQGITISRIARVYNSLGDYQLSIDTYNQALEIFRAIGDRARQASTLDSIGHVYQQVKDYQKSLDYHNQALALAKENNNFLEQSSSLISIVRIYESLKDYPKALDATNQLFSLSRQQKNGFWEAAAFAMSGSVYLKSGDYQKALEATNKAVTGYQKVGGYPGQASALYNLGKIYNALKQYEKALSTYDRNLALRRMLGDRTGEAETLYNVAITQRDMGNLNEARTQIEAAIKIVEDIRTRVTSQELRTSYFASVQNYYQFYIDVLMQLHKQDASQGYDALALHASERARARSLLELLTEANANIRQGVDPNLLEQERTLQQKLDAIEKRRIELVLDQPKIDGLGRTRGRGDGETRRIFTRQSDCGGLLVNGQWTNKQVKALEKETAVLLAEYRQVQEQIRRNSPRYAEITQPQPLTLSEIQQQVLDEDTMLLEYSLGEERSYLWAVTKTSITSYELPKLADIEAVAQSFYEQTGQQKLPERRGVGVEPRTDTAEITAQLSQMLLSPVAGQLGQKRLLIVSDGALQFLPFAALPSPDSIGKDNKPVPMIVKHEIVNLPSASTLAVIRQDTNGRKLAPKTVAVLADPVFSKDDTRLKSLVGQASTLPRGDGQDAHPTQDAQPTTEQNTHSTRGDLDLSGLALKRSAIDIDVTFSRLPFTRKEAENILALVPTAQEMQAFDFAANRITATNPELSQYQIVHFATHGILNSSNPELSGVVLSLFDEKGTPQNGFLRLNDIFNLNLPAELIVLSACETGLGEDVKGEGLVGLTRGFMYAGAPRVLVSLWSVSDAGTSELMSRFYKKMLQDRQKPAAALRAAQIELLQNPQWQDPYYWAAFTLQGEWK